MPIAIQATGLTKVFERRLGKEDKAKGTPSKIVAVDHIDFAVEEGQLFGLLGPNGAGKTTTIRMLSTVMIPDEGDALIAGHSVTKDESEAKKSLGVITGGDRGLYWRLTAKENLLFFARLHGISDAVAKPRIQQLLSDVGLQDRGDELVERYSTGMRQRLHIARGLVNDPPIILMDEPTIGLDPAVARELRDLIKKKLQGELRKTILLTTHNMPEAETLCDTISIIKKGKIISSGTPAQIRGASDLHSSVTISLRGVDGDTRRRFEGVEGVETVIVENDEESGATRYTLIGRGIEAKLPQLVSLVGGLGAELLSIEQRPPTLEDAYVSMIRGA